MKNNILRQIAMLSKWTFYGLIAQLIFTGILLAADSRAQAIKSVKENFIQIEFNNNSLLEVFNLLEQKTGYNFAYEKGEIDKKIKLSKKYRGKTAVSNILLDISKRTNLKFKQINKNIIVSEKRKNHPKEDNIEITIDGITVTGRVTSSEDDSGLPGVNVLIVGTQKGSVTDLDGNYTIIVPEGSSLQFSFIGYIDEIVEVGNRSVIDISLVPDLTQLEEIVVTALGVEKEVKSIGYAVTRLEGKEIAKSSTISPVLALQGKVSGVDIAPTESGVFGGTRITIRGNSTLKENNQPIFVVDGIILDNDISGGTEWGGSDWGNDLKNLNSDDFESVSVLKGAAATALYGARALNGAIVITTKKGRSRKGIGVDVTQTINTKRVYDGPAFQNVYGEGAPPGYDGDYSDIYNPSGEFKLDGNGDPFVEGASGGWLPVSYGHAMDGSRIKDWDDEWIDYTPKPDNYKQVFEDGLYSNTNISFNGGNDRSTFVVSMSHTDEKGTFPRNKFNRNSFFTKASHRLNNFISAQVGASYSASTSQNPPTSIMQNFITGSWPRNYDTEKWQHNYKASHGGVPSIDFNDPNHQVPGHGVWFNIYENTSQRLEESLRITGDLNFVITDWFNIKLTGYINNYYTKAEVKELGQGFANEGGRYRLEHRRKEQNDYQIWLNFDKDLGNNLRGHLSLIGEHWQNEETNTWSSTEGGLVVPGQYTISNSRNQASTNGGIGGGRQLNSAYFFADLEWKDQLFIQITGRNDWSSTLTYSDGSGNNSYFYPSVSASWVFSESFILPSYIDFAKVRASWAHVGNDYVPYNINPGFNNKGTIRSFDGDIQRYGFNSNQVPNLDLKPEDKKSIEVGLDLRFFGDRLGFDFTYYKENTFNQILSIPVPSESGVGSQLINAGNIQNQGIELALNTTPVVAGAFRWDLDFNFTRNRNKIIELYEGVTEFNLHGSTGYGNTRVSTMAFVGDAYGVLMSDSKPKEFINESNPDDPRNGMPLLTWHTSQRGGYLRRSQEREKVGDMNPDFLGGINTRFSYRGLYASILFDVKIGGDISTYSGRYGTAYGLFESTLENRDLEHGGFEWTSWQGITYQDGYIPEGVFAEGSIVEMTDADGSTIENDVSGMTYREAFDKGLVDPTHGGWWHWKNNTWGGGVINDAVVQENSYVGIREVVLGYNFPSTITQKLHVNSLNISLFGRDLGFLYKTLKDNLNPFSIRSNRSGSAHEWQQSPYIMTLGGTIKIGI